MCSLFTDSVLKFIFIFKFYFRELLKYVSFFFIRVCKQF